MPNPNVAPLAQDFAVAARVPDPRLHFFQDPNLARLDDGTLIIAAPQSGRWHTNAGRSCGVSVARALSVRWAFPPLDISQEWSSKSTARDSNPVSPRILASRRDVNSYNAAISTRAFCLTSPTSTAELTRESSVDGPAQSKVSNTSAGELSGQL